MSFAKQLVILVGGKGTRLGALAQSIPKPLMPIAGDKVFLDYFLDNAVRQGFSDVLMLAGHLGDQVRDRYHNRRYGNAYVNVVVESSPMGTGGAFRNALDHLAPTFVAANGDTLFNMNLRALDHRLQSDSDLMACLAVRAVPDAGRFGSVDVVNGHIRAFHEKHPSSNAQSGLINGGIYALRSAAIARLPEGSTSIETDLFPILAREGRLGGIPSEGYFLDIGLPHTLEQARAELPQQKRPALFLDRDGVVNIEKNYLYRIEDFEWVPGAVDVIRKANSKGLAVIVVTNQAGIAHGKYKEGDVLKLHAYMQEELNNAGAYVDEFYYCPYHANAVAETYRRPDHFDRKPNCGMLLKAALEHNLDLATSVLVGDKQSDLDAASAAGVKSYLFTTENLTRFVDEIGFL